MERRSIVQRMRAVRVVRIAAAHFALYCFVVLYILLGAYGFHYLEGEYENIRHGQQRRLVGELKAQLIRDVSRTRDVTESTAVTMQLFDLASRN